MKTKDIFEETYSALSANKIRSGLTMLGIVIGVSSVIAMISIGQGSQGSIQASIQSIGSNLVLVEPGAARGPGTAVSAGRGSAKSLTVADADAIGTSVTGVLAVAPEVSNRYQVTASGQNTNVSVVGVTSSYPMVRNVAISEGSFISDQNVTDMAKVAVIGPTAATDLFNTNDPVGQNIVVKGIQFKIIGETVAKGGNGFGSQDDMIFIPLSTAQRFLVGNQYVTTISVEADNAADMTPVQNGITTLLLQRHNISNPTLADFSTLNQADIVATASSVTNTFTILLAAVAGISLLVGGIGIMNMMLTTVTERTKEIGLRKAIGAKSKDITVQFLVESVMLTFIGGVIGVAIGWTVAFGMSFFGILQTQISILPVFLAFGVSAGIGIVFGYYPARRAAKLNPIEALRYE
jgi:putative ABC transport system permease protein